MRSARWTRWATCALALSIFVPTALADRAAPARPQRSLASCTSFTQEDRGETTVALSIRNACSVPVDCTISWRVVCAPASKKRRAEHPGAATLALDTGAAQTAEASAGVCGDDAWTIDRISWSCRVQD